jgi:hypothetical protein
MDKLIRSQIAQQNEIHEKKKAAFIHTSMSLPQTVHFYMVCGNIIIYTPDYKTTPKQEQTMESPSVTYTRCGCYIRVLINKTLHNEKKLLSFPRRK